MGITSQYDYGILHLTIDNPRKRNAIDASMFTTLTEQLVNAEADDKVRVVLLRGGEQIFSAGADMQESLEHPEAQDEAMINFFDALRTFPKPIVAEVSGPAVGEAFTILLYCDLVYAAKRALFSMPNVALARAPRFGATRIFAQSAGAPQAAEKLLLSEPITADEALQMRLITAVYDDEDLPKVTAAKVARLAVLPPQAVRLTKARLVQVRNNPILHEIDEEENAYQHQLESTEAAEALKAFLEGRKPVFKPDTLQ